MWYVAAHKTDWKRFPTALGILAPPIMTVGDYYTALRLKVNAQLLGRVRVAKSRCDKEFRRWCRVMDVGSV